MTNTLDSSPATALPVPAGLREWEYLTRQARSGKLAVESRGNQDGPLMLGMGSGHTPILGLDVREHACYLKCQNRRDEYIAAFYKVIDWGQVARRYAAARL